LRLLFIGDIVGSTGRRFLAECLPDLHRHYQHDVCLANAENAAAGKGLTSSLAQKLHDSGIDAMTLGNHTFARSELLTTIDDLSYIVRPANVPSAWPGRNHAVIETAAGKLIVTNLLGRIFMDPVDDPFGPTIPFVESLMAKYKTRLLVVDFHAEATSEKVAFAHFMDGNCTLVAGTHTHVQTADERILAAGTATITDVGMTGPVNGVIGMGKESSLRRFVDHLPAPYEVADGPAQLNAIFVEADPTTGRATHIERIRINE
jgi:metallophosphoesterase (TIGR00282 family)